MMKAFENEGFFFSEVCVDDSSNTKILRTENLEQECFKIYFRNYDLENSFVIGDRKTDVELAKILVQNLFYFR